MADVYVAYGDKRITIEVTISSSGTKSTIAAMGGYLFSGYTLPATMTGTSITYEVSHDGTNFVVIGNNGTAFSEAVDTSAHRGQPVDINDFASYRYIKLVSNSAEAAERTIQMHGLAHMTNN